MHYSEITYKVIYMGWLKLSNKTHEATINTALVTEFKQANVNSVLSNVKIVMASFAEVIGLNYNIFFAVITIN